MVVHGSDAMTTSPGSAIDGGVDDIGSVEDESMAATSVPIIASVGAAVGLIFVLVGLVALRRRKQTSKSEGREIRTTSDAMEELGQEKNQMQGESAAWKSHKSASKSDLNMDDSHNSSDNPLHDVEKDRAESVQAAVDPSTGKTYYHNTVTDKTAWTANDASRKFVEKDAAPQASITERMKRTDSVQAVADPSTGKTYYHNTVTDKTAWSAEEASRQFGQESDATPEIFSNPMFAGGMARTKSVSRC
jgi:hypothetical protein